MAGAAEVTISVKMTKKDVEALDRVVQLTGLGDKRGGRSTAVRMLMAPWLEAIKTAETGASKLEVAANCFTEMRKMSDLVCDATERERNTDVQETFEGMEVAPA